MNWSAQNISCAVFTLPTLVPVTAFDVWLKITGEAPQQFQQNPSMQSSVAQGAFEEWQLIISTMPGRVDMQFHPTQTADFRLTPPLIEDVTSTTERLLSLAQAYVTNENPLRVAIVGNLAKIADSAKEAKEEFCKRLKVIDLPDDASDIQFTLNVRKKFGSAGWEMNRLCTWGVGQLQLVQFLMQPGTVPSVQPPASVINLSTLTIDVNTIPRNIPLGPTQAGTALRDLADELKHLISDDYDRLYPSR